MEAVHTGETVATEREQMRTVASNVILHLHPTKVPARALRFTYTWGLGGMSALLVVVLFITGTLLSFRYEPSVGSAYRSIQALETDLMFGSLLRSVHHWSANLLIVTVFLHLLRVLFTGGFKQGRAMNWWIGLALLLIVVAFNFTGYLLPWDQLAYWAITVGTSLISFIPVVGNALSNFLLGGPEVGQGALNNFYAIHVALLPLLMGAVMMYHFWKVRKNGGISQPAPGQRERPRRVTTIPYLVQVELTAACLLLTAIVLWSMLNPAPLGELANPMQPLNPAKAAWYFLGIQELLLHMHPAAALTLVGLILLGLVWLPRWDSRVEDIGIYFRSRIGRWAAACGAFLSLAIVPVLIVADEFWIDLPGWLPDWPTYVSNGLLPLAATLLGLAVIYGLFRLPLILSARRRSDAASTGHGEALIGLFTFIFVSLIVMTIVGIFFRGQNMVLIWPY